MKFQNVHEAVTFLRAESNKFHASHLIARKVVNKYFWEVEEGDIDRAWTFECSTIKGSCKVHQVQSVNYQDPTQVQYIHLTCFCPCFAQTIIQSFSVSKFTMCYHGLLQG
jgi:hypothetical protein